MPRSEPTASTGVVVVGSVTADLTTFSQRLPVPGETILGDDFTLVLGGKGANQIVAAGRAGADACFVGCVGSDLFRDMIVDGLRDSGVDISHLRTVPGPTGIAHIRVDASAQNDIVMVPLANAALSVEQVDAALEALGTRAGVLLTQLEIPADLAAHAIRTGHARGLTVVLDPAPAAALPEELWSSVDIVTPNESEASVITGIDVVDPASAVRAAHWFLERGVTAAVVTLAGAGAMLVTAEGERLIPPFPVEAVDTTAAGDAFSGYLGAALAEGRSLEDAVVRAAAAGALTVTARGASPSLPTRDRVEEFLREHAHAATKEHSA
ncbi:ribokinase [Agromyces sp. SYSU T00194]|uniref:ribokinase n=1 Tax=Agromyces chitinivorans TaxID=3158560 RepID=UPI003390FDA4